MLELTAGQSVGLLAAVAAVAFLYSSVGHGGATGYLAAAALIGLPAGVARPGALWMNCCVAGIAFWRFRRAGFFDLKLFGSFAVTSIPCAWLGSQIPLDGRGYAVALGLVLLAAGWLLGWRRRPSDTEAPRSLSLPVALPVGGSLGFLAGLTGIGGGVFLTPLLIFLRWAPAKTAGGISALFIVANSAAGLLGLGRRALAGPPALIGALVVGIGAALLGAHCGVSRWRTPGFRRALAVVLWIAAFKLILTGN